LIQLGSFDELEGLARTVPNYRRSIAAKPTPTQRRERLLDIHDEIRALQTAEPDKEPRRYYQADGVRSAGRHSDRMERLGDRLADQAEGVPGLIIHPSATQRPGQGLAELAPAPRVLF
jgi:hypothetical protein